MSAHKNIISFSAPVDADSSIAIGIFETTSGYVATAELAGSTFVSSELNADSLPVSEPLPSIHEKCPCTIVIAPGRVSLTYAIDAAKTSLTFCMQEDSKSAETQPAEIFQRLNGKFYELLVNQKLLHLFDRSDITVLVPNMKLTGRLKQLAKKRSIEREVQSLILSKKIATVHDLEGKIATAAGDFIEVDERAGSGIRLTDGRKITPLKTPVCSDRFSAFYLFSE